jgi:hypothetical protein
MGRYEEEHSSESQLGAHIPFIGKFFSEKIYKTKTTDSETENTAKGCGWTREEADRNAFSSLKKINEAQEADKRCEEYRKEEGDKKEANQKYWEEFWSGEEDEQSNIEEVIRDSESCSSGGGSEYSGNAIGVGGGLVIGSLLLAGIIGLGYFIGYKFNEQKELKNKKHGIVRITYEPVWDSKENGPRMYPLPAHEFFCVENGITYRKEVEYGFLPLSMAENFLPASKSGPFNEEDKAELGKQFGISFESEKKSRNETSRHVKKGSLEKRVKKELFEDLNLWVKTNCMNASGDAYLMKINCSKTIKGDTWVLGNVSDDISSIGRSYLFYRGKDKKDWTIKVGTSLDSLCNFDLDSYSDRDVLNLLDKEGKSYRFIFNKIP